MFRTQQHNRRFKTENNGHFEKENKNQGVINTIVNYNRKIKKISTTNLIM